jgi:hypothetical protein
MRRIGSYSALIETTAHKAQRTTVATATATWKRIFIKAPTCGVHSFSNHLPYMSLGLAGCEVSILPALRKLFTELYQR